LQKLNVKASSFSLPIADPFFTMPREVPREPHMSNPSRGEKMNMLRVAFVAVVTACVCSGASAADNKKLIVGKWEVTKADEGTVPPKTIVEFKADGAMSVSGEMDGQKYEFKGTYTVDADSFTFKLDINGKEESKKIVIKKLDEKDFETTDPDNKSVVLKRVK
jgi:uncharacterized protein (TIGR03066 family)